MAPMTPTQRTLKHLREDGWPLISIVEHWNPHARIRQDLFGIIDLIACNEIVTLGIQATSGSNHMARIKKILIHPTTIPWLANERRALEVWSWRKLKVKRGGKRYYYKLRRSRILLDDGGGVFDQEIDESRNIWSTSEMIVA